MKNFRFHTLKGALMASAVLLASVGHAADAQVEALLGKMRQAYGATKSVTFTVEATTSKNKYTSTITFRSPRTLHVSIVSGTDSRLRKPVSIDSDGATVRVKSPMGLEEVPFTTDLLNGALRGNLESICFYDWQKQLSTAPGKNMEHSTFRILLNQDWNGKKWTVLEETAAAEKVVCKYYVDPKSYLIWRTVVKVSPGGDKGQEIDAKILKMGPGGAIPDSGSGVIHV